MKKERLRFKILGLYMKDNQKEMCRLFRKGYISDDDFYRISIECEDTLEFAAFKFNYLAKIALKRLVLFWLGRWCYKKIF